MEMQKTTIRLPKKLLITTKKQALEEGLSLQAIISQGIQLRLNLDSSTKPTGVPNQGRLHAAHLLNFVEKLEKTRVMGPSDLASNIDTYLYGNK